MFERGQCSWVDPPPVGPCNATENLIRHEPRFSEPRLLCPTHLHASIEKERGAASARP